MKRFSLFSRHEKKSGGREGSSSYSQAKSKREKRRWKRIGLLMKLMKMRVAMMTRGRTMIVRTWFSMMKRRRSKAKEKGRGKKEKTQDEDEDHGGKSSPDSESEDEKARPPSFYSLANRNGNGKKRA
jgi:hypothetical protein